jgi:hypothetical protein
MCFSRIQMCTDILNIVDTLHSIVPPVQRNTFSVALNPCIANTIDTVKLIQLIRGLNEAQLRRFITFIRVQMFKYTEGKHLYDPNTSHREGEVELELLFILLACYYFSI